MNFDMIKKRVLIFDLRDLETWKKSIYEILKSYITLTALDLIERLKDFILIKYLEIHLITRTTNFLNRS